MRKIIFALLVAALALVAIVAAGTGGASTQSPKAASTALINCGKTRSIGLLAPITGPAASIGTLQVKWAQFYVSRYNRTHRTKFKLVKEDTQLGGPNGNAEALKGAQALKGNSKVLGVVGPAGSNEVKGTTSVLKGAGFAFISGSATNTTLTTDGTRTGYFFRTVPPDAQQSKSVSRFIVSNLKYKRVYIIDDQEAYSTGLADEVQAQLRAAGVTVTRDGVSQQQSDFAAQVVGGAIDRACKNGSATRAEVRRQVRRTKLKKTLLGLPVRFTRGGDIRGGVFGIYQSKNGKFARIA